MNADKNGTPVADDDLRYLMLGEEGYLVRPAGDTWREESGLFDLESCSMLVADREKTQGHIDFICDQSISAADRMQRLQSLDKGFVFDGHIPFQSVLTIWESPDVSPYWKCHALAGIMADAYWLMPVPTEYSRDVALFVKEHEYDLRRKGDVSRCHVLKLLAEGNIEEMDVWLTRSRLDHRIKNRNSTRNWQGVFLHLLMSQDFSKMHTKDCARLCMTLKWIEGAMPGTIANAKDRFGNNALIYLYETYSEMQSSSVEGSFSYVEAIAEFLKQYGCDTKDENKFGISAFGLVEQKVSEIRNFFGCDYAGNELVLQLNGKIMPAEVQSLSTTKAFEVLEDIDFKIWRYWLEYHWNLAASLLKMHDEGIRRKLQELLLRAVEDSSPYYFTVAACRRDVEWIALASEEIPSIIREERELMERIKLNVYALGHIFKWCESGGLENGLYLPDETCVLDFSDLVNDSSDCMFNVEELELNRWVFLLILFPELAEKCTAYDMFSGFDACMLLAKQPRLACHFSIEAIGNFRGRLWVGYDSKDYNFAWDCLVRVTPEFAKFRMSVERNKNEES